MCESLTGGSYQPRLFLREGDGDQLPLEVDVEPERFINGRKVIVVDVEAGDINRLVGEESGWSTGFSPDDLEIMEMRLGPDLTLAAAIEQIDADLEHAFTPEVADEAFKLV